MEGGPAFRDADLWGPSELLGLGLVDQELVPMKGAPSVQTSTAVEDVSELFCLDGQGAEELGANVEQACMLRDAFEHSRNKLSHIRFLSRGGTSPSVFFCLR